ncbi:MAG TPA: PBP1A family penicillin-binding protein [Bryobacteraceae bacterium]|nr:PBP1A family penicillin-binding protein [Bryobacteraceae bacterium]
MPIRIRVPGKTGSTRKAASGSPSPLARFILFGAIAVAVIALVVVSAYYMKYARLTDEKLAQGPFPNSSLLYAAPRVVGVGDPGTPLQFAAKLREAGYVEDGRTNAGGWYHMRPDALEVFPGDHSYPGSDAGVLRFADGRISSIISLSDNTARTEYTLAPQLLSSLYDKNREKRRLVKYDDIPQILIQAVISIEDKRFFQHSGFDPIRIIKAVFVDVREHRNAQGASTLTQQLARNLWLDSRKTWTRKFDELLITIHLERKLTKQKIFEYYANQVDLGRRGSFAIRGFGEAAQAYFGKDIRQLTLPEAATLAGLIQEPSFRNPVRWPERARNRRNVVLARMLENNYITQAQYDAAVETPMVTAKQGIESADAPYFVDLVNEQLADQFQDRDFQDSGSKIYTTLDLDLQRDAAEAVASGMHEVDEILAKRHKTGSPVEEPQVALICLDPHTGEIKALIGGRNYGVSQLNHILAKRPSGSVFKPFVYAAALNTGLWDHPDPITQSTIFHDEPETFAFNGKDYEPTDYHKGEWQGDVTLRTAFAKSLNVPAVEVAEAAGYGAVADLAHKAGLADIRPTPAMALGAYDVTPLEMAGAYTLFANRGVMVKPRMIERIVDKAGGDSWASQLETKKILDPRIDFLMISLMQEVLRSGTGAGVRARGFTLPAAGKTGTSHDAWFAGFTTKLLCIVWVGLDNYQDLKLDGAKAALPIWTDFMKRAHKHRQYRDVSDFDVPEGVVSAQVDPDSGELATSACPKVGTDYYLLGTQPAQFCPLHQGGSTEIAGWETASPQGQSTLPNVPVPPGGMSSPADPENPQNVKNKQDQQKHGFFDKLKSIFH